MPPADSVGVDSELPFPTHGSDLIDERTGGNASAPQASPQDGGSHMWRTVWVAAVAVAASFLAGMAVGGVFLPARLRRRR